MTRPLFKSGTKDKHGRYLWACRCECGKVFLTLWKYVNKRVVSCGCYRLVLARRPLKNSTDWSGETINHLHVVKEAGRNKQGLVVWEAVCTYENCGRVIRISSECLRKGQESCGCKARQETRKRAMERYL